MQESEPQSPTTESSADSAPADSAPEGGVAGLISDVQEAVTPEPAAPQESGNPISDQMLDSLVFDLLPSEVQSPLEWLASYPLLLLAVVVTLGYTVGKLLQFLLSQVNTRLAGKTASDYDDRLVVIARRPAMTTPVVLSLFLVTAIVPLPAGLRSATVSVLATILLFSFLRAALKASHVFLEALAERKDRVEIVQARTLPMFEMTTKVVLVAVAGYLLLAIWGIDPTAWLASAGVIGIAVGFAARDTLANLFSGVFIVADAPYKLGDYVVLDTGERGEVTHVGLRSTRLLTRDDVEVTIPNAIIANAKIINESGGPWEKYRIRIPVGVSYDSDGEEVTRVLNELARENPDVLDYPAPRVRMRRFSESSLDFEMLGWIDKPVHRGRVTHELLLAIHKRFREEGIAIPFPQRDVHLVRAPGTEAPSAD